MTLAEFSPDGRLSALFAILQFYPRLPLPRSFPSSYMLPLPSLPRPLSVPQATVASASHARTCVATLSTTLHPSLACGIPRPYSSSSCSSWSPFSDPITPSATPTMLVLTFPSPPLQCSSSRWAPGRPSHLPRSLAGGLPEAGVEPVNLDIWLIKNSWCPPPANRGRAQSATSCLQCFGHPP